MTTISEKLDQTFPSTYTAYVDASKENNLAQCAYRISEILQMPLNFSCNKIIGRLMTVLQPGSFGNYNSKTFEIIRRIFLVCISPFVIGAALVCAPLAIVFNFIGDLFLGDRPYLCFLGTYIGEKKETFATFNMSTLLPPMTLIDGVEDSYERLESIANKLRDFHFVCGQEVDGSSARFFADELKGDFREFYTYLGKSNTPFLPSGLFFACKEKVLHVTVVPFTGSAQKTIKRELVIFELEDFYVATMHLDGGNDQQVVQTHLEEIEQAKSVLSQYQKPIILCGDFNENRYAPSVAYNALMEDFIDCIANQSSKEVFTCTDALKIARFGKASLPTKESIDYITYNKNQNELKLVYEGISDGFYLSDHSLIKGRIVYKV